MHNFFGKVNNIEESCYIDSEEYLEPCQTSLMELFLRKRLTAKSLDRNTNTTRIVWLK